MKKSFKYIVGLFLVSSVFSCKKDLDINTNPNSVTEATIDLVLPQAVVATANSISGYNDMGAQQVGYWANGGGVSGWGGIISYKWLTSDFAGNWATTYDVLTDVEYVIKNSAGNDTYKEFAAAAKVLKAYNYALLVDTYNDVPYTQANQGDKFVQPTYDKGTDIYKSIVDLLDQAIVSFKGFGTATPLFSKNDPLYGTSSGGAAASENANWAKFAQTLKLRLILKGQGKVTFTNTSFDAAVGFITDDAMVQPVYAKLDGKQNRMWNRWAYLYSGSPVGQIGTQYVPTPYILGYYDGSKLTDPARKAVTYKAAVATNQLGYQGNDAGRGIAPSSWFIGTSATAYDKIGILKGFDAAQPIMLAAESYFLQAEANLKGILSIGTAATNFDAGMEASFKYLYKNNTGAVTAGKNQAADVIAYKAANGASYLVNYNLASDDAKRLEAIITQKYIAFNNMFGHEAWNEYRRTGYPNNTGPGTSKTTTFTSIVSESTAADKLPTRVQYPANEFKYNEGNVPKIDIFKDKIFWAK